MSPIRETRRHRAAEQRLAQYLARHWQVTLDKTPRLRRYDYTARRDGQIVAVIELKIRNRHPGEFPDVFIDAAKWAGLTLSARDFNCRAIIVWYFARAGVAHYIDVQAIDTSTGEMRGRHDRGGSEQCLVYRVPLDTTTRINIGAL